MPSPNSSASRTKRARSACLRLLLLADAVQDDPRQALRLRDLLDDPEQPVARPAQRPHHPRAAGLARNAPPRTWYGIPASESASSKSSDRELIRYSTAISSYGTPSRWNVPMLPTIDATSASASSHARSTGASPAGRVARSTFSAPPSFGTSRFASSRISGVER